MNESSQQLRDAALASRVAAEELQGKVRAVADRPSQRVENFAKASTTEYESASQLMLVVSLVGVFVGRRSAS
jgi:methyl-accepting chemotaxis protein